MKKDQNSVFFVDIHDRLAILCKNIKMKPKKVIFLCAKF